MTLLFHNLILTLILQRPHPRGVYDAPPSFQLEEEGGCRLKALLNVIHEGGPGQTNKPDLFTI
jgi:hypothetical protein